ncbi:MAG: class I SAM-dependent methyltransferase [Vicinamibacterales bacterium]
MTDPSEYVEEATVYSDMLAASGVTPLRTVLELGSGGGNNASHMKSRFELTLVELSPGMIEVSTRLNPECTHHQGDMRTVRLGKEFDAVFVHDAICYMTTIDDLRLAMETAFLHCRPGGVALFCPDYVSETFEPSTDHGGHDGNGRALRYVEWAWDPDPSDSTYTVDYAYLLRTANDTRVVHDRHVEGLFSHQAWLDAFHAEGFEARSSPYKHSEVERPIDLFLARRP